MPLARTRCNTNLEVTVRIVPRVVLIVATRHWGSHWRIRKQGALVNVPVALRGVLVRKWHMTAGKW
jgi:hypothetical protein